jgi:hypothetical protein
MQQIGKCLSKPYTFLMLLCCCVLCSHPSGSVHYRRNMWHSRHPDRPSVAPRSLPRKSVTSRYSRFRQYLNQMHFVWKITTRLRQIFRALLLETPIFVLNVANSYLYFLPFPPVSHRLLLANRSATLLSDGCLCWLQSSCLEQICHNMTGR